MAKFLRFILSLSGLSLLLLVNPVRAEDYVGRDVPPDSIVVKAIQETLQDQGSPPPKFDKLLGKRRLGDDSLKYFYTYTSAVANRKHVGSAIVEKLDTHIWVVNEKKVIEK